MLEDLQELYKKYLSGDLGGTQPPQEGEPVCESTFCERFESSWFSLNSYVLQFGEMFEQSWFINNNFVNESEDEFEIGWFTSNSYLNQWLEGFEGADWDE